MIRTYRGDNWICKERPTRLFYRSKLSNGQYLSMWFWRQRFKDPNKQVIYIWTVGAYIGSIKGAKLWRVGKRRTKQTGDCGLEGLKEAARFIKSFADQLGYREEMQIKHEDNKRHRAYKWLLRYPGFSLYEFDDKTEPCIAFRNLDYWEWKPSKKGEETI